MRDHLASCEPRNTHGVDDRRVGCRALLLCPACAEDGLYLVIRDAFRRRRLNRSDPGVRIHVEPYADAGVDYDVLDRVKREAQRAAAATTASHHLGDVKPLARSRGESAHITKIGGSYVGSVLECLGTKSTIAREVLETLRVDHFSEVGYDTVAAAVNDLAALGVLPLVVNAYFAVGSTAWFANDARTKSLISGFRAACTDARAAWGGGETPVLSGIVAEGEIDLAASAFGMVPPGRRPLLGEELAPGDEIVLIPSSGLHTNGATLARRVASQLPGGWAARIGDAEDRRLGEAVLDRSASYVPLVAAMSGEADLDVSYAAHVTGHGLRKIMRSSAILTYRIRRLPPVPPVLSFLADAADLSPREAYGTFNMGVGFALFCRPESTRRLVLLASALGYDAIAAGTVEAGPRQVVVEPIEVTYGTDELELR